MMTIRTFFLEAWAILRILNYRRITNASWLITSYLYSNSKKQTNLKGKPIAFAIEPTSICNLKCPECPTGANLLKRPRGMMEIKHYKRIIHQLSPQLMYLNLYVQGEPMMHPEFAEMVKEANKLRLYTSTSTNGHFLTPELAKQIVENKLTRIIFSVDGTSQESYGIYRVGGDFEAVKKSIAHVVKAKKEAHSLYPIVVMQFLVFKHNEHELPHIKKLAKSLKADKLEIKTAQLNSFGKMRPPINARFSRYADTLGTVLKQQTKNRCWRQWHSATLTWDGRFAPCCYDKDATHSFGNTYQKKISDLWFGNQSIKFKQTIFNSRNSIDMCNNCPEGNSLF